MKKDADIDETGKYRYMLSRQWNEKKDFVNFVLFNPSTADDKEDDRTIKACISIAENLGYGGFYVTNLFAYRTSFPKELKNFTEPEGEKNDDYIKKYANLSKDIIVAWGNHGSFKNRDKHLIDTLSEINTLYCLGHTKKGNPRHPLYLKRTTKKIKFKS